MTTPFSTETADRAVEFFRRFLTHQKGEWAGQPFELAPWQEHGIVRPLFGSLRDDGSRQYRTAFVAIPRKAGKSTLAAGIGLYMLLADNEPGAEIYSAAADRDQARIVFELACEMVNASPALRKRCRIYKNSIVVQETGSVYRVLSADAFTKHGLNAHAVIFDELHAQPNRELWDVLTTSTGARRQPLTFAITTAGYDRHSICWEIWDYAEKVRDGMIDDPAFLPVIFAADDEDDWRTPETWAKAHPGLDISIKRDYFAAEAARAQEVPSYENTFRRLLLNQWTEASSRWLSSDAWLACDDPPDLEGLECYAGLDLSTTTDLTALVLAFPDGPRVHLLPFFWTPQESLQRRVRTDRVPYDAWARDGHLEATPGAVVDYDRIRTRINELAETYHIREIAIDRWNATQLSEQLKGDGFDMVAFGQGYASMSAPAKALEAHVIGKTLTHGNNPVLTWCASNAVIETDAAGNIKPSKGKSTERIDGIVAATMALGRLMVAQAPAPAVDTLYFV